MSFEVDRCPYCRATLDVRQGAAQDTTIGNPIADCPSCKRQFKTGKSEWIDKSGSERNAYYLRVAWWIFCAWLMLGVGGYAILGFFACRMFDLPVEETLMKYWPISLSISLVLSAWLAISLAKKEIGESLGRKSTQGQ